MKRRKIVGERKLVKFGQVKAGDTFWWASKKWRRCYDGNTGPKDMGMAFRVTNADTKRVFRPDEYVKI